MIPYDLFVEIIEKIPCECTRQDARDIVELLNKHGENKGTWRYDRRKARFLYSAGKDEEN
jgi:hypothetical protein